ARGEVLDEGRFRFTTGRESAFRGAPCPASPRRACDARAVQTLTIALAQIAPRLGLLQENLERHHALIDEARAKGAGLVVFPELGLTGYLLQDLAAEVAMRLRHPRLRGLGGPPQRCSC